MITDMLVTILLTVALQTTLIETKHDDFVGFTAFKEVPQEFGTGDRIPFEGVLINEGDAYQPALSQFTCPVSGVYYVSVNMMADYANIRAAVIVREEEVFHVWSSGLNDRNTASNSGLVYCESGYLIYVAGAYDNCRVYGETGLQYTTFTVMLLSEQNMVGSIHSSLNGFSVAKDETQDYEIQDVITYSRVNYNDGNYLTNIHRYNCSKSGVYFINFNNHGMVYEFMQLGIEHSTIMALHARDTTMMNRDNAISNSRLIYCEEGEILVVKGTGSGSIYGSSGYIHSSFNGFLLPINEYGTNHDDTIGFSVYKRTPQSYNASRVITFDGILWDEDNSYDRVLNRFQCPVAGIYYISVTFKRYDVEPLYMQVSVQSQTVLRSEDASSDNPWNTISNSGLVPCLQGWNIQVISTGTGSVYGNQLFFTTFTAFLMHEY